MKKIEETTELFPLKLMRVKRGNKIVGVGIAVESIPSPRKTALLYSWLWANNENEIIDTAWQDLRDNLKSLRQTKLKKWKTF